MSASKTQVSTRRAREARERRRTRLIVYGASGVLVVAVAVVLVGLYVTQYRPPRAHVLSVGGSDYNASEVARRATYEVLFGGGVTPNLGVVVADTLQVIEDEAIVHQRAPATVGAVTADDIDAELRERLGVADSDVDSDEAFGDAFATLLRAVDLPRGEYEAVIAGEILLERLGERFRPDIAETTAQLALSRIRLLDEANAEEVRTLLLEGADFAELAAERSIEEALAAEGGDLGWRLFATLSLPAEEALASLEAGEISAVVSDGLFVDVYLVTERDEARPLEPEQIDELVVRRQQEWLDEQRLTVRVENDLSDGEESWILERLLANVARSGGG